MLDFSWYQCALCWSGTLEIEDRPYSLSCQGGGTLAGVRLAKDVTLGLTQVSMMVIVIPDKCEFKCLVLCGVNSIVDGDHLFVMLVNPSPFAIECNIVLFVSF